MPVAMDFSDALAGLRLGIPMRRRTWAGQALLKLVRPTSQDALTSPFFARGQHHWWESWGPTHADLLAQDWERAE